MTSRQLSIYINKRILGLRMTLSNPPEMKNREEFIRRIDSRIAELEILKIEIKLFKKSTLTKK